MENSYYANVRMATVLVCLLWWLSRGYFRLLRIEREALGPLSFGYTSAFLTSLFIASAITRGTA